MNEVLETPFFGAVLTMIAYETGVYFSRRFKLAICNPMLIASILIIGFLLISGISLETYNIGGDYISIFLAPATAVLAIPLYKQINNLKKNLLPILIGIIAGSLTSFIIVVLCAKLFCLEHLLRLSLLPKSITIPMGIELSKQIGAVPAITIHCNHRNYRRGCSSCRMSNFENQKSRGARNRHRNCCSCDWNCQSH